MNSTHRGHTFRTGHVALGDAVEALAWSADGALLAAGDLGGAITIVAAADLIGWDRRYSSSATGSTDPAVPRALHLHSGGALALAWHPARPLLASGDADGTVALHDLATGDTTIVAAGGWVHDLAWSPDGDLLAIAAGTTTLIVDRAGAHSAAFPHLVGAVRSLAWVDGPAPLATGTQGGIAWLSPEAPVPEPVDFDGVRGAALRLAPTGDRRRLAAADLAGHVHVMELVHGDQIQLFGWDYIDGLAWSGDGDHLAVAGDDNVTIWRFARAALLDDEPRRLHTHADGATTLTYHGTVLATGGDDGLVAVHRAGGTPPVLVEASAPVRTLVWHPDGALLVAGTADGLVSITP